MSQRLSRKEIKHRIREDEVRSTVMSAYDWVAHHPRIFVAVLSLVLLAVIAAAIVNAYFGSRAQEANTVLASALKVVEARIDEESPQPDDPDEPSFASEDERRVKARQALEKIPQGIGSGPAGDVAELLLADLALEDGDAARAREIWDRFLAHQSEHVLALSVRLNLIRLDRAEGRSEEVAESLRSELDNPKPNLPEDVLLFELAQTLDSLDREDEARELYQRILDDHPSSPFAGKARQLTAS